MGIDAQPSIWRMIWVTVLATGSGIHGLIFKLFANAAADFDPVVERHRQTTRSRELNFAKIHAMNFS